MHEITCIITTSPIESHPSTAILEETVASIRHHLPISTIIIACDGIRPEQESKRDDYEEYLRKLTGFVEPGLIVYKSLVFLHQALIMMDVLDMVKSPLVLTFEHDTPLLERPIDWDMLKEKVLSGETNHIRLHYDEQIHPDHEHLTQGKLTDHLIKTVQYHNRPFITRTDWFKQLLHNTFNNDSRSFLEDKIYGVIVDAPWSDYKLTIYDPEGTGQNMKRSGHTNGRGSEKKYDMVF